MLGLREDGSFEHLDPETREVLISLIEKRTAYFAHQTELNRLRIAAIRTPTPEALQAVEEYAATHVRPLRESMAPEMTKLMEQAINVERLMNMLPMVLSALTTSVDVPLLLTILGADPDMISTLVGSAQEYFRGDF